MLLRTSDVAADESAFVSRGVTWGFVPAFCVSAGRSCSGAPSLPPGSVTAQWLTPAGAGALSTGLRFLRQRAAVASAARIHSGRGRGYHRRLARGSPGCTRVRCVGAGDRGGRGARGDDERGDGGSRRRRPTHHPTAKLVPTRSQHAQRAQRDRRGGRGPQHGRPEPHRRAPAPAARRVRRRRCRPRDRRSASANRPAPAAVPSALRWRTRAAPAPHRATSSRTRWTNSAVDTTP